MKSSFYLLLLITLFSISCNSVKYAEKDFTEFNSVLKKAQSNNEAWTASPVGIATKYHRTHNGANEFSLTQIKKNRGESFDKVDLVLTSDGLLDDSVNGIKTKIRIVKKRGNWQVDKIEEAYKCAEGRGQSKWAGTHCE